MNRFFPTILCFLLVGCATAPKHPNLGELYNDSAMYHGIDRNPVIVLPGITGSKLIQKDTEQIVWGAFGGGSINPHSEMGIQLLSLPIDPEIPITELSDDVVVDGALEQFRLRLLGLPLRLNAYYNIMQTLGAGQYYDQQLAEATGISYGSDHYTCFQFAYDWRHDIAVNAKRLHHFIMTRRVYVQREIEKRYGIKNHPVKFDIVAHSMGGLVSRYYLRYGKADLPADGSSPKVTWEGAKYVGRLFMIGTPNAGSADALIRLTQGQVLAPTFPKYEPAILGTMPAVYELLPYPEHRAIVNADDPDEAIDVFDANVWKEMGWGLMDPKQDRVLRFLLPNLSQEQRREQAYQHLKNILKRTRRMQEALGKSAKPPKGLEMHLYAGDAEPTIEVLEVDTQTGKIRVLKRAPGDGIVLRTSALFDNRQGQKEWTPFVQSPIEWTDINFIFSDHLGLTKSTVFADNLLFTLLEKGR